LSEDDMKKWLCVIAAFALALATKAYSECELRVGFEQWEPFQFKDHNGNFAGLDLEVVKVALEESGCKANFIETSWQRLMVSIENGSMDVAMGASKAPEREKYAYFSIPYRDETYALFLRKNDSDKYHIQKLDDLVENRLRFGIVRGYYYGEPFNEAMKNPRFKDLVEEAKDDDTNIRKLKTGRIQGCFIDPYTGVTKLKEMDLLNEIVKSHFVVESGKIHAMFSKQSVSSDRVKAFDNGLQGLINSGQLIEIIQKYL
jgi:polar amino acid transport system substrate-binding protein